jgi:hypothetical protein
MHQKIRFYEIFSAKAIPPKKMPQNRFWGILLSYLPKKQIGGITAQIWAVCVADSY